MDTFEIAKAIQEKLLENQAQCVQYGWSSQFVLEELTGVVDKLKNSSWFKPINPNSLSMAELKDLGFKPWTESGLMLIPLWLFPFLTETFVGGCIIGSGVTVYNTSKIDKDSRCGCIAYGVYPSDSEENNQ